MLGMGLASYAMWGLYLAIIAAALVGAFRRPEVALYVLLPLLPNQTVRYKLQEFALGSQIVDILLVSMAIGILAKGGSLLPKTPLRGPIVAMWCLTYLTLWMGSLFQDLPLPLLPSDARFSVWKNYCRIPLILFLAMGAMRDRRHMTIAITMMSAGLIWVNRGFLLSVRDRDFSSFSYGLRDTGTMPIAGENGLAAFLGQMALFLIGVAVAQTFGRKWAVTGLAFVSVISLTLTFSRGGYLGFLAGFLVLGLLKRRALLLSTLVAVVITTTFGYAFIPNAVIERITMTHSEDGEFDTSTGGRLEMWQIALDMFASNPLLGAGFDTFRYLSHHHSLGDTHNYYLRMLAETGLAGLIVYLWLIGTALKTAWGLQQKSTDPFLMSIGIGTTGCMICVFLVNLFGDRWSYLEITGYTFTMLAMVARGHQILEEEETGTESSEEGTPRHIPEHLVTETPVSD